MKFGTYIEVNDWCTMVCRMTRSKVKVTSDWKPLKRSQLSVPHGTKFSVFHFMTRFLAQLCVKWCIYMYMALPCVQVMSYCSVWAFWMSIYAIFMFLCPCLMVVICVALFDPYVCVKVDKTCRNALLFLLFCVNLLHILWRGIKCLPSDQKVRNK